MQSKIVELLTNAHRMIEHIITLIRLQADMLHRETEAQELAFLQRAIAYMNNYPGLIHHPAEEMIFDHLVKKRSDALQLCAKLVDQHKEFSILETTVLEYIGQAHCGNKDAFELIKKLSDTYCREHADHLALEENEMLPRAISVLAPDDWRDVACRSNLHMDPLGNVDVLKNHDNLYDYIMSTNPNLKPH